MKKNNMQIFIDLLLMNKRGLGWKVHHQSPHHHRSNNNSICISCCCEYDYRSKTRTHTPIQSKMYLKKQYETNQKSHWTLERKVEEDEDEEDE